MKEKPQGKSPGANGGSVQRLVRRRALHTQESPVKSVPTRRAARPRYGARNDNRETREIHEKKSRPTATATKLSVASVPQW